MLAGIETAPGTASRDGRLGDLRVMTSIVEWEPLVRTLCIAMAARGRVVDRVLDLPSEVPGTPSDRCTGR